MTTEKNQEKKTIEKKRCHRVTGFHPEKHTPMMGICVQEQCALWDNEAKACSDFIANVAAKKKYELMDEVVNVLYKIYIEDMVNKKDDDELTNIEEDFSVSPEASTLEEEKK